MFFGTTQQPPVAYAEPNTFISIGGPHSGGDVTLISAGLNVSGVILFYVAANGRDQANPFVQVQDLLQSPIRVPPGVAVTIGVPNTGGGFTLKAGSNVIGFKQHWRVNGGNEAILGSMPGGSGSLGCNVVARIL